jgi:hypothetical protein
LEGAKLYVANITQTEADLVVTQDKLLSVHMEEVERKDAEFYNLGWASSESFMHSKTNKGRLFTQLNVDGTYSHEWGEAGSQALVVAN